MHIDDYNKLNVLLNKTRILGDNDYSDSSVPYELGIVEKVYDRVINFLREYNNNVSKELLYKDYIDKKYKDYLEKIAEIFNEFGSNGRIIEEALMRNRKSKAILECFGKLIQQYREVDSDEISKGVVFREEPFLKHLLKDDIVYCLVKERDDDKSIKESDITKLYEKNAFFINIDELKKQGTIFNTFKEFLDKIIPIKVENGSIESTKIRIKELEGYVLYRIQKYKAKMINVSEYENNIIKDIIDHSFEKYDDCIIRNEKNAGKYNLLINNRLLPDEENLNVIEHYLINPFNEDKESFNEKLSLSNFLDGKYSKEEIRKKFNESEKYKMKINYVYLNKLKELGEGNVTKKDIDNSYVELIIDVITAAKKKHLNIRNNKK